VNTTIAKSEELDIVESKGMVQFAQLKGMSDLLSLGIQNAGFQVRKFLPFGTVENMIPYLMRRVEEHEIMLVRRSEAHVKCIYLLVCLHGRPYSHNATSCFSVGNDLHRVRRR
jgi:hypothetical protein